MKGRIQKTIEQKHISGTLQPCRISEPMQPKELVSMPRAPKFLSKVAKRMWYEKGLALLGERVLTGFDVELFGAWCIEAARYYDLAEKIEKLDPDKNRSTMKMLLRMSDSSFSKMAILGREFGLTPLSRLKFSRPSDPSQLDLEFENL